MISMFVEEKTVQIANFFFLLNRRNRIQSSKKCSEKKRNFLFKQFISRSRVKTVDFTRWTQPVMLISLLHIVVSRREQVTVFLLVLRSEVELLERL